MSDYLTTKLAESLRHIEGAATDQRVQRYEIRAAATEALRLYDAATPAPVEPVAWMIRSRTGLIRCCLTEEPDDERRALAEIDGDTITPLFAAPVAANVPAGWRMVPEKPTPAMLEALRVATRRDWPSDEVCRVRYAAMLAAAPEAATPAPAEPPTFARRWRIASDGFGLQRDDEDGCYVHYHDAAEVLHRALEQLRCDSATPAQAQRAEPLTESALCRQVCEYGPQSEDEETGFRDGFRAAERVHGIGASTKESNQ